ncbi:MAG: hypothetical protein COB46_02130 [Rhodospirillaceae bacterium]|nr:MAG: hypothetical protein COB46_02130 [Rhodospirillaceae bacterium]
MAELDKDNFNTGNLKVEAENAHEKPPETSEIIIGWIIIAAVCMGIYGAWALFFGGNSAEFEACRENRDAFVSKFVNAGLASKHEAEGIWYENQITVKFSNIDCSRFAKIQMKQ